MLRTLGTALTAVAVASTLTTLSLVGDASAADTVAPSAGCVDKSEYRRVSRGDTQTQVARAFKTRGRQTSTFTVGGDRYTSREYKACTSRYGFVSLDFKNKRLTSKFAYWG